MMTFNKRARAQWQSIPDDDVIDDIEDVDGMIDSTLLAGASRLRSATTHRNSHDRRVSTFSGALVPRSRRPLPSQSPVKQSELAQLVGLLHHKYHMMEQRGKELDGALQYEYEHSHQTREKITQLQTAKEKAVEREEEIFKDVIFSVKTFLSEMILITNLFNNLYTSTLRAEQQFAREKYAKQVIDKYDLITRPMENAGVESFIGLMFAGLSLHIGAFKKLLTSIQRECQRQQITITEQCEAHAKAIERAFYKAFYVYNNNNRDDGYKQLKDVLRASLVFESFDGLYRALAVIAENENVEILHIKDRFAPDTVPFGYRDVLIHFYCPGSKIICELQLQLQTFYVHKKESHDIYKKARLFEQPDGGNLAYEYACKYIKPSIRDDEDICSYRGTCTLVSDVESSPAECEPKLVRVSQTPSPPRPLPTPPSLPSSKSVPYQQQVRKIRERVGTDADDYKDAYKRSQPNMLDDDDEECLPTPKSRHRQSDPFGKFPWLTPSPSPRPQRPLPPGPPRSNSRTQPFKQTPRKHAIASLQEAGEYKDCEYNQNQANSVQKLRVKTTKSLSLFPSRSTPKKPLPTLIKHFTPLPTSKEQRVGNASNDVMKALQKLKNGASLSTEQRLHSIDVIYGNLSYCEVSPQDLWLVFKDLLLHQKNKTIFNKAIRALNHVVQYILNCVGDSSQTQLCTEMLSDLCALLKTMKVSPDVSQRSMTQQSIKKIADVLNADGKQKLQACYTPTPTHSRSLSQSSTSTESPEIFESGCSAESH